MPRQHSSLVVRAWRSLDRKHWLVAAGCGVLVGAVQPLVHFEISLYWAHWRVLFDTPYWIAAGCLYLWTIALADASVPAERVPSMGRYAAWLAAAGAVCVAAALAIGPHVPWPPNQVIAGRTFKGTFHTPKGKRTHAVVARYALPSIIHGTLGSFMFIMVRNSRRAARALAEAEIERSEAARRLLQSSIDAARGQVDPDTMLRSLEEIERTYDLDPALADRMMDTLIETLRDAMPRLRPQADG